MTLRCTIEIVLFGNEELKSEICRLDISNTGAARDEGFGNQICSYYIDLYRHNNETIQRLSHLPEWELVETKLIPEHNRRDGAVELVRKACEIMKDSL